MTALLTFIAQFIRKWYKVEGKKLSKSDILPFVFKITSSFFVICHTTEEKMNLVLMTADTINFSQFSDAVGWKQLLLFQGFNLGQRKMTSSMTLK